MFSCIYSISASESTQLNPASVLVCHNTSSEFTVPLDGSVLFVIDQPEPYSHGPSFPMDLSTVPTYQFPSGDALAFLLCSPHVSIQTRQVWAGMVTLHWGNPSEVKEISIFIKLTISYLMFYFILLLVQAHPMDQSNLGQTCFKHSFLETNLLHPSMTCLHTYLLLSPISPLSTSRLFLRQ